MHDLSVMGFNIVACQRFTVLTGGGCAEMVGVPGTPAEPNTTPPHLKASLRNQRFLKPLDSCFTFTLKVNDPKEADVCLGSNLK